MATKAAEQIQRPPVPVLRPVEADDRFQEEPDWAPSPRNWRREPGPAFDESLPRGVLRPPPSEGRAIAAIVVLAIAAAASLVSLVIDLMYYDLLGRVGRGEVGFDPNNPPRLETLRRVFSLLYFAFLIAELIVFLMWLYAAHVNLTRLGARGLRFSSGWAVGYFFIPILNLFRPVQAMQEIWKASAPDSLDGHAWQHQPGAARIGFWWACWLISTFVGNIAAPMELSARDVETFRGGVVLSMVSTVFSILAGLLSIAVIRGITIRQRRKYERLRSADANDDLDAVR